MSGYSDLELLSMAQNYLHEFSYIGFTETPEKDVAVILDNLKNAA